MSEEDESQNLVTNWIVESQSSSEEFKDYNQALSLFKNISGGGKHVILYETKKNPSDGSTVKKIPLLNSKKIISTSQSKKTPQIKSKFKDLRVRIFLLIVVLFCFLIIIYFMNIITTKSSEISTVHNFMLFFINSPSYIPSDGLILIIDTYSVLLPESQINSFLTIQGKPGLSL